MRTLFLNPNSDASITATFLQRIDALARTGEAYEVARLPGSPRIIASPEDNLQAQAVLLDSLEAGVAGGFQRLVLMSSLDTGYEVAQTRTPLRVHGFTRSVLEWNRRQGRRLHAVTFDAAMTPLYQALSESPGCAGVVRGISTVPMSPASVTGSNRKAMEAVRALCRDSHATPETPLFIVGAVGLTIAQTLRKEDALPIIDPVADLLARLDMRADPR